MAAGAARTANMIKTPIQLLLEPPIYCGISNRYAAPDSNYYLEKIPGLTKLPGVPFPCYLQELPSLNDSGGAQQPRLSLPPSPQKRGLLLYYSLDVASLYPVLALDVSPDDTILDMCAAPGGKAFAMLQTVNVRKKGVLALNETSHSRVSRLVGVLNCCLGKGLRQSVRVTQKRGEEWAYIEQNEYDKVLVDAPCSSDRHNINLWMTKGVFHPKTSYYAKLQQNLLLAAFSAVKDGGVVVYSTCTEAERENDMVVENMCRSARNAGMTAEAAAPIMDDDFSAILSNNIHKQKYGTLILPTPSFNVGPIYTSRISITKKY